MRRLMYIPGIWSLGLLFPLCVWYLYRQGVWKQERCITMTFPIPKDQMDQDPSPAWTLPRERRQEWTTFYCNGHEDEIDATLLAFQDSLRHMESRGDTTRGIHVRFGPDTKYATIISAIEICRTTVMAWELDDHDLWTLHYPEPKRDKVRGSENVFYLECGTMWMGGCLVEPKLSAMARLKTGSNDIWNNLLRPYWMVWSLLLMIGILALRRTLRAPSWAS